MYSNVLVPLDRSPLAEQALPLAVSIAQRADARLDLVEVHALYALEEVHAGRAPFQPELDDERRREEELYLAATARWVSSCSAVAPTAALLRGSTVLPATVADAILQRAREGHADLIVTTTNAPGPVTRFFTGSVGDELVRRAEVPLLLVRPRDNAELMPGPVVEEVLVLLDGSPLAERALAPAAELARLVDARTCLLRVLEKGSAAEKAQADAYLGRLAVGVRKQGVVAHTRVLVARRPVEAILAEAVSRGSDLIALASHGRGGVSRLVLGSVADQIIRSAPVPVLICPPCGKAG